MQATLARGLPDAPSGQAHDSARVSEPGTLGLTTPAISTIAVRVHPTQNAI
jgi:hypothetical protein